MKRLKNVTHINIVSLLLAMVFLSLFVYTVGAVEYADIYTSVLEDLQSSAEFRNADGTLNDVAWSEFLAKYPEDENNHGLDIITIAESNALELFIYVYQPSHNTRDHVATHINMSLKDPDTIASDLDGEFELYNLELVSTEGVFDKYLVKNFVTSTDDVRYYNVATIYRPYDKNVDPSLPDYNENIVNSTGLAVGKCYVAETHDDTVSYYWLDTEVIKITSMYVGQAYYSNGYKIWTNTGSGSYSHFIAFSTDMQIDQLLKVSVNYDVKNYTQKISFNSTSTTYKEVFNNTAQISYEDVGSNNPDGWFARKYTWDCIENVEDFLLDETVSKGLSDEGRADVENEQWVVRFLETEYSSGGGIDIVYTYWSEVSNVAILELTFRTNGVLYTLGVVSNRQTGSGSADLYYGPILDGMSVLLGTILSAIVVLIFVNVLGPFVDPVWDLIKMLIKYLFIGIWYVISLPFRLLHLIFSKDKRR